MSRKLRKQQKKLKAVAHTEAKAEEQYFQTLPAHFKPLSQKNGVTLLNRINSNQNPGYYYDTRSGKNYKVIYRSYDGAYTAVRLSQSELKLLTCHSDAASVVQKLGKMDENATLAKQWLLHQPLPLINKCHQILSFLNQYTANSQEHVTLVSELADIAQNFFFSPSPVSPEVDSAFARQPEKKRPEQLAEQVEQLVTVVSTQELATLPKNLSIFIQALAADYLSNNKTLLLLNETQVDALLHIAIKLDPRRFSDLLLSGHSPLIRQALALLFLFISGAKTDKPDEEQVNLLRHLYGNRDKVGSHAFQYWLQSTLENLQNDLPDCPTLTSAYRYYAHWHIKGVNPLTQPKKAAIILPVAIFVVWFCGQFYGEENVKTGTWAAASVTNILLPFVMYLVFRLYSWTHWRSASYLCIAMILCTALIGHSNYFQDSKKHFAGVYHKQLLQDGRSIPTDANSDTLFRAYLDSRLPDVSGVLFFDHLRFRAMVGTWSEERAYIYGPYIEVHRQGVNVWFNWVLQLLIIWITCGFAFIFAKYPAKRNTEENTASKQN